MRSAAACAGAQRAARRAMSFLAADPARQPVIVSAVRTPIGRCDALMRSCVAVPVAAGARQRGRPLCRPKLMTVECAWQLRWVAGTSAGAAARLCGHQGRTRGRQLSPGVRSGGALRQRVPGRRRPGAGAAGFDGRGAAAVDRCDHCEQGLRLRHEDGIDGRDGDSRRHERHSRGRRHGVDEQRALFNREGAIWRLSVRKRQNGGLSCPRRPVGPVWRSSCKRMPMYVKCTDLPAVLSMATVSKRMPMPPKGPCAQSRRARTEPD